MLNKETLDSLASKVCDLLPETLRSATDEVKTQVKSAVSKALQNCELVSREEFEQQKQLLDTLRQQLIDLRQQLDDTTKSA